MKNTPLSPGVSYICIIRDNVSGQTSPLFFSPNDETSIRQFKQFLTDNPNNPKDYDLYTVGSFHQEQCIIDENCCRGSNRHVLNGAAVDFIHPIEHKVSL